ncbi:hypothetical protein H072_5034 [Dactylellina haptotyla CBS 200.50]|uniref:Uncharacterized protein n=1 Tax=Dactylellina haptotyla (strain CBS 200.50) TaxID=1284197 RepID=S8AIU9_DACHA|nr:hypothetical protein H072_5034 [Dactylellina haptotyla CBS 200.50]
MSTSQTPSPPQEGQSSPTALEKGKWVERPAVAEENATVTPEKLPCDELSHESPAQEPPSSASTTRTKSQHSKRRKGIKLLRSTDFTRLGTRFSTLLQRLFFCCLSTRPKYTKIQHLVIPTSQVCVDSRALHFLQDLSGEEFQLLQYIVQEVFTDDGAEVLGRIPDYDDLIEAALKSQIRTAERPWVNVHREGYVEHVAGLYARLLRKLGTYERAPMCEKVYDRKYREQRRRGNLYL